MCCFRKLKGMISSEGPGGRVLGGNVSARKAGEGGSDLGSVRSGVLCPLRRTLSTQAFSVQAADLRNEHS